MSPRRPLRWLGRWLLALWLAIQAAAGPSLAQTACDCPQGLEHLCRCAVLIDDAVANQQLAYLQRLMAAEFGEHLEAPPAARVRLGRKGELMFRGIEGHGLIDGDEIRLYDGLFRDRSLMVLAHELGHAWHFSVRPDQHQIDDMLVEGFAEWVAYHLMRRAGLTEFCSTIKENPDPVYGRGFRWFLEMEQEHGRAGVLNIMREWSVWPG